MKKCVLSNKKQGSGGRKKNKTDTSRMNKITEVYQTLEIDDPDTCKYYTLYNVRTEPAPKKENVVFIEAGTTSLSEME